ncbi:MAG: Ig-like domain-containing protein, partial [Clostridiales bacterium]|nr:Ig-like domain-containing protein [Clostridiales bacterium]
MLKKTLGKVSSSALAATMLLSTASILSYAGSGVTVEVLSDSSISARKTNIGDPYEAHDFDRWLGPRTSDPKTVTPRNRSYYDAASNTLYVDEYQNYVQKNLGSGPNSKSFIIGDNAAFFQLTSSNKPFSTGNPDIENKILNEPPYGATAEYINGSSDHMKMQYAIYLSNKVPEDSSVSFGREGDIQFKLNLKKRVPVTSYILHYDDGTRSDDAVKVFFGDVQDTGTIQTIAGYETKLSLKDVGTLNGNSVLNDSKYNYNDIMLYQIKDASGNFITGSALKDILHESEDGRDVSLTFQTEGTYTLRCMPISIADLTYKDSLRSGSVTSKLKMPSYSPVFAEVPIKINALNKIDKLTFDKTDYVLGNKGSSSVKLSDHLTVSPSNNNDKLTWSVAGDAVKVDQTGTVTAVKAGTAKVSVRNIKGDVVANCNFKVINAIQSIDVRNSNVAVPQGHSLQLDVVTSPSDAEESIEFISEDPSILSVNSNGVITALANGSFSGDSTVVSVIIRSESGTEKSFPISVIKATNTVKFDASINRVSDGKVNLENSLIDYGGDRYGLYNSQKLEIKLSALGSNGKESNDTIEWRATVDGTNLKNVPLSSLGNYGYATLSDYNKKLVLETSKDSNQTIYLTAYAVDDVRGINNPYAKRTFTIDTNKMTNKIVIIHKDQDVSARMDLAVGTTTEDIIITVNPTDSKNKDRIYIESSAPEVVKVDFNSKNNTFKLTGIQPGQTDILVYATYDPSNPKTNYSYIGKMVVTTKTNIASNEVTAVGLKEVTYRRTNYNLADFPDLALYYKNKKLIYKVDYEVEFKDNVNAGTAKVIFKAKGDSFTGERTEEFKIKPYTLTDAGLDTVINPVIYSGNPMTPGFAKNYVTALETGIGDKDFTVAYANNINAGTADAIITGQGNYTGTVTKHFEIKPLGIDRAEFESIPPQTVTGKAVKPKVVGTLRIANDVTVKLVAGKDYQVKYTNNKKVGRATATITGLGNFDSFRKIDFDIVDKSAADFKVSAIADKIYNSNSIEPKPTIKYKGKKLKKGKDYSLSYSNNVEPGTATIHINGMGAYKGSKEVTFKILPQEVKGVSIKTSNGGATVNATWKPQLGVDGYNVYRIDSNGNVKKVASVSGRDKKSATITKNPKGSKFKFVVVAYKNSNGKQIESLSKDLAPATVFADLTASGTKVKAKWEAAKGVKGYQIQYSTSSKFKSKKVVTVNGA